MVYLYLNVQVKVTCIYDKTIEMDNRLYTGIIETVHIITEKSQQVTAKDLLEQNKIPRL